MPVHFSTENKRQCKCEKDCYSIDYSILTGTNVPGSENMEISSSVILILIGIWYAFIMNLKGKGF